MFSYAVFVCVRVCDCACLKLNMFVCIVCAVLCDAVWFAVLCCVCACLCVLVCSMCCGVCDLCKDIVFFLGVFLMLCMFVGVCM